MGRKMDSTSTSIKTTKLEFYDRSTRGNKLQTKQERNETRGDLTVLRFALLRATVECKLNADKRENSFR
jgi:hypothetical protein